MQSLGPSLVCPAGHVPRHFSEFAWHGIYWVCRVVGPFRVSSAEATRVSFIPQLPSQFYDARFPLGPSRFSPRTFPS